jgi:hypothetical protein
LIKAEKNEEAYIIISGASKTTNSVSREPVELIKICSDEHHDIVDHVDTPHPRPGLPVTFVLTQALQVKWTIPVSQRLEKETKVRVSHPCMSMVRAFTLSPSKHWQFDILLLFIRILG